MNVNTGSKVLFVVIGSLSLAVLWRAWPLTEVLKGPPGLKDEGLLQRVIYRIIPLVLPVVFAISVLYCAFTLFQ